MEIKETESCFALEVESERLVDGTECISIRGGRDGKREVGFDKEQARKVLVAIQSWLDGGDLD